MPLLDHTFESARFTTPRPFPYLFLLVACSHATSFRPFLATKRRARPSPAARREETPKDPSRSNRSHGSFFSPAWVVLWSAAIASISNGFDEARAHLAPPRRVFCGTERDVGPWISNGWPSRTQQESRGGRKGKNTKASCSRPRTTNRPSTWDAKLCCSYVESMEIPCR